MSDPRWEPSEWDDASWDDPEWDDQAPPPRNRLHHRVALVMLGALVLPLVLQFAFVARTVADRLGVIFIAVPVVVVVLLLRGRSRRD